MGAPSSSKARRWTGVGSVSLLICWLLKVMAWRSRVDRWLSRSPYLRTGSEYDALVLFEAPDDTAAASFALAIAAGGAAKSAKTTRLLSGQEWIESLRKAQGSQYRRPQ
jgi:hypothetical protein